MGQEDDFLLGRETFLRDRPSDLLQADVDEQSLSHQLQCHVYSDLPSSIMLTRHPLQCLLSKVMVNCCLLHLLHPYITTRKHPIRTTTAYCCRLLPGIQAQSEQLTSNFPDNNLIQPYLMKDVYRDLLLDAHVANNPLAPPVTAASHSRDRRSTLQ